MWEKVLVSTEFANSTHGSIGCRTCHGGGEGELEKEAAHEGMIPHPSDGNAEACQGCHADITFRFPASLHATQQGYFTAYENRAGATPNHDGYVAMFNARCNECHASCGQCHVTRPISVGGGLTQGHVFTRSPSQTNQCTACHGSRVGDEFRGRNEGLSADVHYLSGMNCMDCHTGMELHGDGTTPVDRHANEAGPRCVDCHPDAASPESSVAYHQAHAGVVACQVCHSVSYKNCYSCHVELDAQGLRFPSRMDFRIGRNHLKSEQRPYDYVLVRHIPIAPDTFEPWDLELPGYADAPTWRYATPHNIQRNTPQTASCGNCHGSLELFLTRDYIDQLIEEGVMVSEEIEANEPVIVDEGPGEL